MKLGLALLLAMNGSGVDAAPCPIPTNRPTAALGKAMGTARSLTTTRIDPDSGEPVVRTIVDYPSGSTIIVEQSNCQMENLRVIVLSRSPTPTPRELARAGTILDRMPIWRRHFRGRHAGDVLRTEVASRQFSAARPADRFFYAIDGRLDAPDAATEAILSFNRSNSPAAQYRSQLELYLGIGGQ